MKALWNHLRIDQRAALATAFGVVLIVAIGLLLARYGVPGSQNAGIVRLSVELPPGQSRAEILLPGGSSGSWDEIQQMISSIRITRNDGSTRDFSPHQFDKLSQETHAFREVTLITTNHARITLARQP